MTDEKRMAFNAELSEMTLEQVNERLAADEVEVRDTEDLELVEEKTEQKQLLLERKAELEDLAKRTAAAAEIKAGEAETHTIEERKDTEMDKTFAPNTVEYRDAYMKALMGKPMDVEERAALASAASVIPTETLNKIYGKLEENPLIAELNALHIPGYVAVPKATTVNDASWVAIGNAATDSSDAVGSVSLTAKKLIKTIEITADIQAMSIPAFQTWLVNKLAQKMEAAICAAVVNGAGSSTVPTGIGQAGITASTALSTPTVKDFAAFMGGVNSAYHKDAVWIMSSKTFFGKVVGLANDVNGGVVMNGLDYRLLGHKVILSDACDGCKFKSGSTAEANNADHVIFGSLAEGYVFNYGEGIAIEADQSVAFRSGSTVYRAMALCDGAVVDPEAFAWATIA